MNLYGAVRIGGVEFTRLPLHTSKPHIQASLPLKWGVLFEMIGSQLIDF
jgi:hypothetical protein